MSEKNFLDIMSHMDIKNALNQQNIKPDPLKDQYFLKDEKIIQKIVNFADLNNTDVVLEVGAGIGYLTKKLAQSAGRVIAFETDERFKLLLDKLPSNVDLHYENAWDFVKLHGKWKKKKVYNKIVSNLPYSFIEQFLHNLTFLEYDKAILLIPVKMVNKINNPGVFSSFFKAKIILKVPKEKFFPVPNTDSVVIDLQKLPDPIDTKTPGLFLRQYMYQHENQLVKNSLVEGIVKYSLLAHKQKITKNQARKIISQTKITKNLLEKYPSNTQIYKLVEEKFTLTLLNNLFK